MAQHDGYGHFPDGFFGRGDEFDDRVFYEPARLVTHIDTGATASISALYDELDITGRVLDLMGSWVSHFETPPAELVVLGMNTTELVANPMAARTVAHDLNSDPVLPFENDTFDDVVCAVSVDYLTRPIEVFQEVARVLRPGGRFVCTFSNRCFPTKAIRGWLMASESQRCQIVATYFALSAAFQPAVIQDRSSSLAGDPLYAVWGVVRVAPQAPHRCPS